MREMTEAGRSSVRVNGRLATAGYVREIGDAIAEIVGQHEAQRLLSPRAITSSCSIASPALPRCRRAERLRGARARAAATQALGALSRRTSAARAERYDDACFTVREIDEARLQPGEDERLDERRRYLDNVERIATALQAARRGASGRRAALSRRWARPPPRSGRRTLDSALRELAQRGAALQGRRRRSGHGSRRSHARRDRVRSGRARSDQRAARRCSIG